MPPEKTKRRVWSREETLGFLRCYIARKNEFLNARGKGSAYEHVLEDMIAQGVVNASMTTKSLESRMRVLLSAYKSAKDSAGQTGASPCPAPYNEQMDEIFGSSVILSNNHTVHFGEGQSIPLQQIAETPGPSTAKVKKSYKENYYKAKLEMKKEYFQSKEHAKNEKLQEIKKLNETMQQKLELEQIKIELLKNFLKDT